MAASNDNTGHAALGGDWELEYTVGQVDTEIALSEEAQQNWGHLLNVTVDATSTGTAAQFSSGATVSHNTTGMDRLMLVGISFGDSLGESVDTVTYNGAALTRVGFQNNADTNSAHVEIWSLVAPDTGTHDVVVNFSGSGHAGATVGVITFNGVDQATALGSFGSSEGDSAAPTTTVSSNPAEIVFSVVGLSESSDLNLTPNAGSETWDLYQDQSNGAGLTQSGAASVVSSWTVPTSGKWAAGGVSIKAASSEGMAVWRDNARTGPEYNVFDGSAFGTAGNSLTLGELKVIQAAEAPTRDEAIVVGVETGSRIIRGQIWNGTTWTALPLNNLGIADADDFQGFDVAYEQASGDAVIVWNDAGTLKTSTWNGTSWTAPATVTAYSGVEARHMNLAASPNSDEMVLTISDTNKDEFALVWDGSSWGNQIALVGSGRQDHTDMSVTFERVSGDAMVVYAKDQADVHYRTWNGSSWSGESAITAPAGPAGKARWTDLAADPNSDRIGLAVLTESEDLWLAVWDGSTWNDADKVTATLDTNDRNYRNIAIAFENAGGEILATYGSEATAVSYRTWAPGGGWTAEQVGPNLGDKATSMTLDTDPQDNRIMLSVLDEGSDLNFVLWDGTAWGTPTEQEIDTGQSNAQPFAFVWQVDTTPSQAAPTLALPNSERPVFINEIHYDNLGTDTGEAIELAGRAGSSVNGWSLVLYNGADGSNYRTEALSGTFLNQSSGYGTLVFNFPTNGIQNDVDAIALVDAAGTVREFISYEGAFTALDGPAQGLTSVDIGVAESGTTPVGYSLQQTGVGPTYTWQAESSSTFGTLNTGQSFAALPSGGLTYREGDVATVIDATARISDVDSADFALGKLTVDFTAGGTAERPPGDT